MRSLSLLLRSHLELKARSACGIPELFFNLFNQNFLLKVARQDSLLIYFDVTCLRETLSSSLLQ